MSSRDKPEKHAEGDLLLAEAKPQVRQPPLYRVIILNDDYTPMEFVVEVLEVFFGMQRERAVQIMMAVHTQGSAVAGLYPRDIAETKAELVNTYAKDNEHPLRCEVGPATDDSDD